MPHANGGCVVAPLEHAPAEVGSDAVRILRRLDVKTGATGRGNGTGPHVGLVLDVETTGLDVERDAIIELAVRRFRYDDDGVITHIDRPYDWVEDPGHAIPAEIAAMTGIKDSDVVGRIIDEDQATRLLRSANFVIAHNSRFDRRWVERRLENAQGLDWACSMEQIDWRGHGFDGRGLGYLLCQTGWFHDGHRAGADVDAAIQLLQHRFDDGRTALSTLIERATRPSWVVRAVGAAFDVKDQLRARGYRWDAARKTWWTEVADDDRMREEFWLAGHVYTMSANPKALGPSFTEISPATRFL